MNLEVFFKRGLLLVIFLFLINVVSAAHTVDVQLINYTSFYETQNANFSITVNWISPGSWVDKINISIPLGDINVLDYKSIEGYSCSNNIALGNFIINCTGITGSPSAFLLNITANILNSDKNIAIDIYSTDVVGITNKNTVVLNILNDPNAPTLFNETPKHQSYTKGLTQEFSIEVQENETGIKNLGILEYCIHSPPGVCQTIYTTNLACTNTKCITNLDLSSYTELMYAEFRFRVNDFVDNQANSQWFYSQIDRTVPIITLQSPINGLFTNITPGSFDFTATDNLASNFDCELFLNGNSEAKMTITNDGLLKSFGGIVIPNGINNWYVQCTDLAGN
ncbi:hypothetical protein J4404_02145, partial [Candidatus Woesearchaeota archaeon]|nr:hypothetical protein [Candidatus Woesearchaeota archaeon]